MLPYAVAGIGIKQGGGMPAIRLAAAVVHVAHAQSHHTGVVFPISFAVVDGTHAQFQFFIKQPCTQIQCERIFRLQGLEEAAEAEAAFQTFGYAPIVIVEFEGSTLVAHHMLQAVSAAERGEEAAVVETALQFYSFADGSVVLNHSSVRTGGIDLVFDFVAVISEADVALAQLGEMRGEIEVVADFPVGAAFRFECMFCYIEVVE